MKRRCLALATAGLLAAACAGAPGDVAPTAASPQAAVASIPMRVLRPEGAGPFPAVVVLHDCSGLGPRSSGSPKRWADILVRAGYVVVLPDSFSPRGFPNGVCVDRSPLRGGVSPYRRVADAYAALAYARTLPYVDGAHVGVMGGSHGGSTTLATMVEPRSGQGAPGFAAAVALYPGCHPRYRNAEPRTPGVYEPNAPLLILAAGADDWTPADACRELAERARAAGYPVAIKIYRGAHHAFDSAAPMRYNAERVNPNAPGGHGATTGGDPRAWADSIQEVRTFFARNLHDTPR